MATKLTKDNFNQEVLSSSEPVLVDFFATWCGPCKMLSPIIEELSSEADGYSVGKIDVDQEMELASQFGVASIPTVIVFKDGKVAGKSVGFKSKAELIKMIEDAK